MMAVDPTEVPRSGPHPLPPAAHTRGLFGDLRPFQQDPLNYLVQLSRHVGTVARFRASLWDIYLVAHPDMISELLVNQHASLSKNTFTNQILQTVAGNGLLTLDGEAWRERRQLLQPVFGREQVDKFAEAIRSVTLTRMKKWQSTEASGIAVDVSREMSALALEIACKAFFGIEIAEGNEQIRHALDSLSEIFAQRTRSRLAALWGIMGFPSIHQQKLSAAQQALNLISLSIVTQLRGQQSQEDNPLLQVAQTLSDREFCGEVRTLLVAGHETTAKALTWSLYLLGQHPEVADKLAKTAETSLDVAAQHYPQQVVEEVLRLYPPVWTFSRRADQKLMVAGYRIPKNSRIMISPYVTHRLPEFWPEPERFDPERHSYERKKERHPYALIPFGVGGHQCIGRRFAMQEMQLILPMIAQRFQLSLVNSTPIQPNPQNTLTPNQPVLLQFKSR